MFWLMMELILPPGKPQWLTLWHRDHTSRPCNAFHFQAWQRILLSIHELDYHRASTHIGHVVKHLNSNNIVFGRFIEYQSHFINSNWCLMFQPKQGWHSLKATCSVDLCHRCLKQHAKLHRGEIDSISRLVNCQTANIDSRLRSVKITPSMMQLCVTQRMPIMWHWEVAVYWQRKDVPK